MSAPLFSTALCRAATLKRESFNFADARTFSPGVTCRFCGARHLQPFVNLGMSPPCESFLTFEQLDQAESFYPLDVRICPSCLLVQLRDYIPAEDIFTEYA